MESTPAPAPASDPGIITPDNAGDLTQLRQLGMGWLVGRPVYSPDGRWLFVPTTTGVYLYDANSNSLGGLLIAWDVRIGGDAFIDISPDGKTLVAAANELVAGNRLGENVHLIAVEDGHELPGPDLPADFGDGQLLRGAEFSPDGSLLVLDYYGKGPLGVWGVADGRLLYDFQGDSLEFSADSRLMVLQDAENVHLYDLGTAEPVAEWAGERSTFLPGNRLAVESSGSVRVFDLETGRARKAFDGRYAAFSSDGQLVALMSMGQLRIYRVSDGQLLARMEDDNGYYRDVDEAILRFAPDGQIVAAYTYTTVCCGGYLASLSLWRVADGMLLRREADAASSWWFEFAPDSRTLAVASLATAPEIWNTSDGSTVAGIGEFLSWPDLAFRDDRLLAVSSGFNPLLYYEIDSGRLDRREETGTSGPIAFSPDGETGARSTHLWRVPDGRILADLNGEIGKVLPSAASVAFSTDNKTVAIGGYREFLIGDLVDQTILAQQTACADRVGSLSFSAGGTQLALACSDVDGDGAPFVQVRQGVPEGQLLVQLETDGHGVGLVAYSPDGRFLAGAGDGAFLWSASDAQSRVTISVAGVQDLAFSPDGRILALGLQDGSVELWAVDGPRRVGSLPGTVEYNPVTSLAFSPDGKLLAVGRENGSVRIFGIP
jgi:WD40 repeat protein